MEVIKVEDNVHKEIKPATIGATCHDEIHGSKTLSTMQAEVIKDPQSNALRTASSSDAETAIPKKEQEWPAVNQRLSRVETVREDARKLKSATLNRMGKMFRQRSQTPAGKKSSLNADSSISTTKSVEDCSGETSKKEKSNSLGRILKLVDKDGSPKKLFHPRAGSLSRILRRNPNNENTDNNKPTEDNTSGIFSRMLRRPTSGNATIEPNVKSRNKMSSLPPKVPRNSRAANLSSSTSSSSPPSPSTGSPQNLSKFEYSV